MAREDWYADSWLITEGWIRDVSSRSGLYKPAGKRGSNTNVANRRGTYWAPKVLDEGQFTLNVWLGDVSRELVEQWWNDLLRAVYPSHRLVRFRRTLPGGGGRYCMGEVVSAIEPTPIGQVGLTAAIEVRVPDGVWWDSAGDSTDATGAGAGLPQRLALASKGSVSAPQDALRYTITGPIASPQVYVIDENGVAGDWFAYDDTLAAGQTVTIDADAYTVTGGGGLVADIGKLRFSGLNPLTVPAAPPGATPTVELRGTGGGGGTALTVTGTAAWLV